MSEQKRLAEIGIIRCRDLKLAEEKLNDAADLGYEVVTTVATVLEDGSSVYLWTLRLRPEVRADRPTLADRVTALETTVESRADHHAGGEDGIQSRLGTLEANQNQRTNTLANLTDRIESLEAAVLRLINAVGWKADSVQKGEEADPWYDTNAKALKDDGHE